jgi:phosphoglycolate phosphatase
VSDAGAARTPPFDPSRIRGLVFDLDGTLVDSYAAIAASVNAVLAGYGEAPLAPERVRRMVGHGLERLMRDVVGPERAADGARAFREHYDGVCREQSFALPGARDGLAALRDAGVAIAVASNKPARFSRPILETVGLAELVPTVHGPDTVGSTKPDPGMIRACLRAMGVEPADAAYVGDMVLDVESAARAGLPVVLVTTGSSDEADLRRAAPDVFPDIPAVAEAVLAARRSRTDPVG